MIIRAKEEEAEGNLKTALQKYEEGITNWREMICSARAVARKHETRIENTGCEEATEVHKGGESDGGKRSHK